MQSFASRIIMLIREISMFWAGIFRKLNVGLKMTGRTLARLYKQTTPRGRGMLILLAGILFLAVGTGEASLYRLSYFLALTIGGCYLWSWLNLWWLDMWVEGQPTVAQVGEILKGRICVRNNSWVPTRWVEVVHMSDMPGPMWGIAVELPARGCQVWPTERFCYARGVYTIGPLIARGHDPLGLFRVEVSRGRPVEVVVYPAIWELPHFRLLAGDMAGEERARHPSQTPSSHAGTVREYNHGDSLSRIHWPSTAKCGRLMSKEFDSGGYGDVWIVVDLERRIQESRGMEKTDEYAVSIAASLAHLALQEEQSVGLLAYGDKEYLVPPGSGATQMSKVLETLTRSKTEGNTPLAMLLADNVVKFGRFASAFVITSSTTSEWIPVLESLTYRGVRVVVVLVDPVSFGGDRSCNEVATELVNIGIPVYIVRRGDRLSLALSQPVALRGLRIFERCSADDLALASEV